MYIYIVYIMILSLLLLQYNIVIYYINCLTRKYTFWIKAQFVDNLSNCKNEKMIERKKVKMLLCTTPWSPAPHPNYFCIRCAHCDIPFPFSLQWPPHLMFAKSHDSIYYGLASLVEMQQNGLAMPVPTNYVDQRHFSCWSGTSASNI